MNVQDAWKMGITGKDVVVTILDDGIEKDHPDLKRNYVSQRMNYNCTFFFINQFYNIVFKLFHMLFCLSDQSFNQYVFRNLYKAMPTAL